MTPEQYKQLREIYLELLELPAAERLKQLKAKNLDTAIENEVISLLDNTAEDTIIEHKKKKIRKKTEKPKRKNLLSHLFSASLAIRTFLLLGLVLIILLGIWSRNGIKNELIAIRKSELQASVKTIEQSINLWIEDYKHDVKRLSLDREFRQLAIGLVEEVAISDSDEYKSSEKHLMILELLREMVDPNRYSGYAIINRNGVTITTFDTVGIGLKISREGSNFFYPVFNGESKFAPPYYSPHREKYKHSGLFGKPNVVVGVPIYDFNGNIIAAFIAARDAHDEFSDLLHVNRLGETGESYVINKNGLLLTESRFEEDLKHLKFTNSDDYSGMLSLYIKDPGVNLLKGEKPKDERESWRLTKAAQTLSSLAIEDTNASGESLKPYRDYRGKNVIGAWVWIKAYNFGLITEMDEEEAFAALPYISWVFVILIFVLALLFVYSLANSISVQALKKELQEGRIGNYHLGKKIGEGGMSTVYLGTHELLKRPTAIKILKKEELNSSMLSRFKTEAKQVSRLRHPNTISIYDYGETESGVFYYAMEFVDGLTIKDLVKMNGKLPIARAVHIMLHAAYSLKEAHDLNLIHRDIKPQNIMLCVQGGIYDMVKVLDFGLVKDMENGNQELTRQAEIAGTPLYMSPERITNPIATDQRSDIYALAAVGYFMIAGVPLFEYKNDLDVMAHIINTKPEPLLNKNDGVPAILSNLIDVCLDKDPDERPESIDYLIKILEDLTLTHTWGKEDAFNWWQRFKG